MDVSYTSAVSIRMSQRDQISPLKFVLEPEGSPSSLPAPSVRLDGNL